MPFPFKGLKNVRDFLARSVHKEINIYKIENFFLEPPEVIRNKTRLKTEHANLKIDVNTEKFLYNNPEGKKFECTAKRYKLLIAPVAARNQKIKRYFKQDVKTHKIKLVQAPKIHRPLKQVQNLPQERRNILKLQKKKPSVANNEIILACYGPIIEGAVDRIVLNKNEGTLFVWYSSSSRQRKPKNVYLIRRLGMDSKPEWRWS